MISLDLSSKPVNLDGTFLDESFGKIIAEHVLARSADGPPMKCWEWAQSLYRDKAIQLDSTDLATLVGLVMSNRVITNQIKAQISVIFDSAKGGS